MAILKSRIGAVVIPALPINRRTFDILRYELLALCTRALNAINPSHQGKVRKLRERKDLSVNLGSGGKGLPGWINVELRRHHDTTFCLDIRHPLPLADGSVARMLAEHVVEHLDFRQDIPRVLADWHRVLRPDGVLRIIVPDVKRRLSAARRARSSYAFPMRAS
ncbi:class I SAM-dependent methyltransferase [Reyranella sp.]|uniref:class I SAM-dependent methyltransferase n=1 Tax=Reyranella sp. TaxID=1929291 RepID=UPI003D11ECEB